MKKLKKYTIIAMVVVSVLGAFALFLKQFLEIKNAPITAWEEDPTGDCVVVLTGGQNRLREGLDFLARKQTRKLIIAGVVPNVTLREIFPLWPYHGDVNEQDVILERRSTTTFGNAQQTLPIVEALGCREVILITSSFHMARAVKTFQSTYPSDLKIIPYSIFAGKTESSFLDISTEVLKSFFYSLWAYSNLSKILQN